MNEVRKSRDAVAVPATTPAADAPASPNGRGRGNGRTNNRVHGGTQGVEGADRGSATRLDRAGLDRLISAASGLAATIATTEQLAQQRADVLESRGTIRGRPARHGRHAPIVSLAEAARRTGRHPEVLRRWCTEGRIPAVRIGRTWGITPETLALLMAHSTRSRPRLPGQGRG